MDHSASLVPARRRWQSSMCCLWTTYATPASLWTIAQRRGGSGYRASVAAPTVDTASRQRRDGRPGVAEMLAAAVQAVPGGTARPGQHVMAEAAAKAAETGEHLLVQAGTGT